jgi:hypothetical protein
MQPEREIDADQTVQQVVDAWAMHMSGGNAEYLTADFK